MKKNSHVIIALICLFSIAGCKTLKKGFSVVTVKAADEIKVADTIQGAEKMENKALSAEEVGKLVAKAVASIQLGAFNRQQETNNEGVINDTRLIISIFVIAGLIVIVGIIAVAVMMNMWFKSRKIRGRLKLKDDIIREKEAEADEYKKEALFRISDAKEKDGLEARVLMKRRSSKYKPNIDRELG